MVRFIVALAMSVHGMDGLFSTDAPTTAPTTGPKYGCGRPCVPIILPLDTSADGYEVTVSNLCIEVAGDLSVYDVKVPAEIPCSLVKVTNQGKVRFISARPCVQFSPAPRSALMRHAKPSALVKPASTFELPNRTSLRRSRAPGPQAPRNSATPRRLSKGRVRARARAASEKSRHHSVGPKKGFGINKPGCIAWRLPMATTGKRWRRTGPLAV